MWSVATGSWIKTRRFRCRAEVNRLMIHYMILLRRRVGRCAFCARLLRQWHFDEVFVKINGVKHDLWRAVDHEGEVLESFVAKRRDKKAALKFL